MQERSARAVGRKSLDESYKVPEKQSRRFHRKKEPDHADHFLDKKSGFVLTQ
jgi:hypothetical protein